MTPDKALVEMAKMALDSGEQVILCTVVCLQGSGYGRPGARLLLTESGARLGYISGGCLERDLCRQVWHATSSGPSVLTFDTRDQTMSDARFNTGCEGVVTVFCQRLTPGDVHLQALELALTGDAPVRLAMIYQSRSETLLLGHTSVLIENERIGNEVSHPAIAAALDSVDDSCSVSICDEAGGQADVFLEKIDPPNSLFVFGTGDDVQPLVAMAVQLGWQVTVIGRHPETTSQTRFPGARVLCGEYAEVTQALNIADSSMSVLMTHDLGSDLCILPTLLRSDTSYIGILGPKKRLGRLVKELHLQNIRFEPTDIDRIHAPVGLDIGAIGPQEIALSIMAELVAESRGRSGASLHSLNRLNRTAQPTKQSHGASIAASSGRDLANH